MPAAAAGRVEDCPVAAAHGTKAGARMRRDQEE